MGGTALSDEAHVGTCDRTAVLLSPHPDDAVFSVWHALSSDLRPTVVTMFCGLPPADLLTSIDAEKGAAESRAFMQARLAQNRLVLEAVGVPSVEVELQDVEYRAYAVPALRHQIERDSRSFIPLLSQESTVAIDPSRLVAELGSLIDGIEVLYAPLGIGSHPDHTAVALAAARLTATIADVRFYADTPYYLRHGLPSCVSGVENQAAERLIAAAMAVLEPALEHAEICVVRLTEEEAVEKMRALRGYETEFDAINSDFGGILDDPANLATEVYWRVRRG